MKNIKIQFTQTCFLLQDSQGLNHVAVFAYCSTSSKLSLYDAIYNFIEGAKQIKYIQLLLIVINLIPSILTTAFVCQLLRLLPDIISAQE